jgi:hypothetical protein
MFDEMLKLMRGITNLKKPLRKCFLDPDSRKEMGLLKRKITKIRIFVRKPASYGVSRLIARIADA